MMAKAKEPTEASKEDNEVPSAPPVFDVSKPGKTAADPSSRPLIVTHKPMIKQDPMVAPEQENEEEKKPLTPKREAVVEPSEELKAEAEEKSDEKAEEKAELDEHASSDDDSAAIDSIAEQAEAKHKNKKQDEEIAKKAAEVENLIQSKQYNLPIHDASYRSRSIFTLFINLLLILMVVAALFVLAVDAEMIDAGLELPFDLIK